MDNMNRLKCLRRFSLSILLMSLSLTNKIYKISNRFVLAQSICVFFWWFQGHKAICYFWKVFQWLKVRIWVNFTIYKQWVETLKHQFQPDRWALLRFFTYNMQLEQQWSFFPIQKHLNRNWSIGSLLVSCLDWENHKILWLGLRTWTRT